MNNLQYKRKRFLLPILSLVLILIFLLATIGGYITINLFKTYMNEQIELTKKEYIKEQKAKVYKKVNFVNTSIKYEIKLVENILKASLKEKVKIALNIAQSTYKEYKNTHSKEEIKNKIAKRLELIKFNSKGNYYFMYDNKTKIIFGHPIKEFIGKDMTNFKDSKGQNLMTLDNEVLAKNKFGFNKIYFNKPNNQNNEFPKITCVSKFEPLDLVFGIGDYLDVLEKKTKEYVLNRFSQADYNQKNDYVFIIDIHNIKGGKNYGTVILMPQIPKLEGKKLSDDFQDVKGNYYRKNVLKTLNEKGEGFVRYWYEKPSSKVIASKMSYFYLQKDWNWAIGSGFYYEDLEKKIASMEKSITTNVNNIIEKTLIWVIVLSLIAIIIGLLVSLQIDKTIKKYTDTIIDYESNKRKNEHLLIQQNKLASMGEMIGNIAHQWRQPLSVISTSSTGLIMQQKLGVLNNDMLIENCNFINNNAQYLSKTIDDFRNFIKADRTKKIFLLTDNINNFSYLLGSTIKNHDIKIVLNLDDSIKINGYENELTQCIINIFNNAKDALLDNKIKNKLIFISSEKINDKAIIRIKDNAGGIPEEILPKVFEPYFTTKHKSLGTGIGLHMTYNLIVDGAKGDIIINNISYEYEGNHYIGAEVKIILPIS